MKTGLFLYTKNLNPLQTNLLVLLFLDESIIMPV